MSKKLNINEFLDRDEEKDLLRLFTAGSVDDGKSTLIGRLLFDSKTIYEDQLDALERDSKRIGNAGENTIDYSLLLDGLKAEREQGITIDVAYRYFSTNARKFIIADTPGHEQYTRNMITGGSTANLAIVLINACSGVITQTRRHTFIASLLGVEHIILAVNKMDLVDYDQSIFDNIVADYMKFTEPLNIPDIRAIPLSALLGDNVVEVSDKMPWYRGQSLLECIETVEIDNDLNFTDFRYPVQYVLRPNLNFRGFSAKISSGVVRKGDEVTTMPSMKRSKVSGIHVWEGEVDEAFAPQSITLTLEDEIDISRGDMIVHHDNLPIVSRNIEAMVVWVDEESLNCDKQFFLKHTTQQTRAKIDNIKYRVDVNTMEHLPSDILTLNEIGRVQITTTKPLFFDSFKKNRATGSFIIIDPITNNTSGVGMIIGEASQNHTASPITLEMRDQMLRSISRSIEKGCRVDETIFVKDVLAADALQRSLFTKLIVCVVLNSADLNISHDDVVKMAQSISEQGVCVIVITDVENSLAISEIDDMISRDKITE